MDGRLKAAARVEPETYILRSSSSAYR